MEQAMEQDSGGGATANGQRLKQSKQASKGSMQSNQSKQSK